MIVNASQKTDPSHPDSSDGPDGHRVTRYVGSGALRLGAFALVWWALTGGTVGSWLVGLPAVLIATLISLALVPPFSWSLTGVVYFLPFFVWQSLRGGTDVAWRAFHPQIPINPGIVKYPLLLPPGLPRVFLINTVSLLPGTLSAELEPDELIVHALDTEQNVLAELKVVEQVVARLFAISLKNGERNRNVQTN